MSLHSLIDRANRWLDRKVNPLPDQVSIEWGYGTFQLKRDVSPQLYQYWTGVGWTDSLTELQASILKRNMIYTSQGTEFSVESVESPGRAPAYERFDGAKLGVSTEELSRCTPRWAASFGRVWGVSMGPVPYDWQNDAEYEKF